MFKKVYSLHSAFCTQPAFYSQSAVCILLLVRSLQSAVRSLRFTLTDLHTYETKVPIVFPMCKVNELIRSEFCTYLSQNLA